METVNITVNEQVTTVHISVSGAIAGLSAYMDAVVNGFFEGTKEEWFASMKGNAFTFEDFTPEQLFMLKGDAFTYEDFTPEQLAALKGDPLLWQYLTEEQKLEITGDAGKSAYEVALDNGFEGSESEWLDSLRRIQFDVVAKTSGVDAGIIGDRSLTSDFEYVCVETGDEATAIWKKISLIDTN